MQRDLTYAGDVNGAFKAVLDVMTVNANTDFLWGLPRSHFELALSWESAFEQADGRK